MKEGKEVETGQTERTEELHFIQSCRNRFQKAIFQGFLPPETLIKGTQGQENTDPDKAGPLIETVQSICRTRVQAVFLPSLPTSPPPPPPPLPVTFYRKFRNFLSPPLSAKPFQPPDP